MADVPKLLAVIGVSGSGKSSVAKSLAEEFSWLYLEADDFHSQEAVAHMASGLPLTDNMRKPWLTRLTQHIAELKQSNVVLAYSGLKRAHRELFRALPHQVLFVHLNGSYDLIHQRMQARGNHFMPSSLLQSQFDDFESLEFEPDVIALDIDSTLVETCRRANLLVRSFVDARC